MAGYSGLTHEAYALDLRQYATYCANHHLALFEVKRAHIEAFARQLEAMGRARATIARRLCTITCFYRYAEQEGLIPISPAVHVRRPRLDYESHATGLDRACPKPPAPISNNSGSNAATAPCGLSAKAAES